MIGYSSKAKLIWDILFRPKRVEAQKAKLLREQKERLEEQFLEKLDLLNFEQEYNQGIVRGNNHSIVIMETPIRGIDHRDTYATAGQVNMINQQLSPICISYANEGIRAVDIKRLAADRIGQKLVELGFLRSEIHGNTIRFTINAFGMD